MAVDLRQVMAAFLTFSMFIMLGNMIKRDHIDPLLEPLPESPNVQYDGLKVSKPGMLKLAEIGDGGLWRENSEPLKPCWNKPPLLKEKEQPNNGYIFFSLSPGPEFHASQIANAVAVAKQLGATLVVPAIRGAKFGDRRQFGEIYDLESFITSLNGIVRVDKNPPANVRLRLPIVRVPNRVSKDFIASNIEPIFRSKRSLKIVTYFDSSSSSSTVNTGEVDKFSNAYRCLATFESLKLQTELQELVDSMVGTLRSMSQKTRGRFVAVDLRVEMLKKKSCQDNAQCYNAEEIGMFLRNIGFQTESTIYLTQTGWNGSLNAFRNVFPNTFTKDAIMPADQKAKFMDSEIHEYEKFIDMYMCTEGDVFVSAFPSSFYSAVAGKRIGKGKTRIFLPAKNSSTAATDYVSPYIAKRSHFAYSCFC